MSGKKTSGTHRLDGSCGCCAPRRSLLTGFAAMAASSLLPAPAPAQTPAPQARPHRRPSPFRAAGLRRSTARAPGSTTARPSRTSSRTWTRPALRSRSSRSRCPTLKRATTPRRGASPGSPTNSPPSSSPIIPAASAASPICRFPISTARSRRSSTRSTRSRPTASILRTNYDDQVPRRSGLRAGVRGAQPPQRGALHPPDQPSLLRAHRAGAARRRHRIRHQHDARHRQDGVQRAPRGAIRT